MVAAEIPKLGDMPGDVRIELGVRQGGDSCIVIGTQRHGQRAARCDLGSERSHQSAA
jgi:hypothetical protein